MRVMRLGISIFALSLCTSMVWAQPPLDAASGEATPPGSSTADTNVANPSAASSTPANASTANAATQTPPYERNLQAGLLAILASNSRGAIEALTRAIGIDGNRAEAHYYLGVNHQMANRIDEAVRAYQLAARVGGESQPRWAARALQGAAQTLERVEGRIEEARAAWQAYLRYAEGHQTVAYPDLARSRLQAINAVVEQDFVYNEVRQRIRAREAANAAAD